MLKTFSIILLLSLTGPFCQASSVWKVSNNNDHFYIGGTIHILSEDDYPLPNEFKQAYDLADTLVFETDIQAINSIKFQQDMVKQMTYTDGTDLTSVLSQETFEALKKHLLSRNVPIQNVQVFKPSLLVLMLSNIEFQAIGLTSIGVDQYFYNLAKTDKKVTSWLESPQQQIDFLADMGQGDEDELVAYTLRDLVQLPNVMKDMKAFWRSGNIQRLNKLSITPFKQDYPDLYQQLIVQRNTDWLPKLESLFDNKEIELVLVGALHLAGEDSVLNTLRKKGYDVEKVLSPPSIN